jgi:biopolymer transport protein TolR
MAGGITSGRSKRRLAAEINVVPYIDVMLVLLIIFMVTAPLIKSGVDVDLPQTDSTSEAPVDEEPILLTIDKNGAMYMDVGAKQYDEPLSEQEVLDIASAVVSNKPGASFYIEADRSVAFESALQAMTLLRAAGVESASFASIPASDK